MHGVERTSTSAQIARQVGFAGLAAAGALLVGCGALSSNDGIEQALTGEATGALEWGPALFRQLLVFDGLALLAVGLWHLRRSRREHPLASLPPPGHNQGTPAAGWEWGLLGGLMILALALRLWRLDTCLWLDEVLTLVRYARSPFGTIVTSFPDQNQHMLYSVLAHYSLAWFGESAWSLRLPAVLFGVASVWALYALGREITTRGEALLAAALMTVSYHHVWFSQNARGYTGLLLFTLLATRQFLRGLRASGWKPWIAYALCVALGLWTHLTMVFVVLSHVAVYAWMLGNSFVRPTVTGPFCLSPAARWHPFWALALGGLLALEGYALSLPQFLAVGLREVSLPSMWTQPLWVLRETIASMQVGLGMMLAVLVGGALSLAGLASFARRQRVFLALLVLPGLAGAGCMLVLQHNLWPRFFFFTLGYLLLIVVRGAMVCGWLAAALIFRTERRAAWGGRFGVAAATMMIAASIVSLQHCYRWPKQDYLGAKAFVQGQLQPGDTVVAVGLATFPYAGYYAPSWRTAATREELQATKSRSGATWLVYTFPNHLESYCPDIWSVVQKDFPVVRAFPGTLGSGEIYVCRSRSAVSTSQ